MDVTISTDCVGVNWQTVSEILKSVGMAFHEPAVHRKAFEASYAKAFAYHAGRLIGFGRAISDGAYQAALYDMAVANEFQAKGVGKMILSQILSQISGFNIILYASPGREGFYRKHGFRKMETGMAFFINSESMRKRGFTD